MIFVNFLFILSLSYAETELLQLRNGFYQSQDQGCQQKRLITINKGEEKFYLIGKNRRFLISPKDKTRSESKDNCLYTYTSKSLKNKLIETKTTQCERKETEEKTTLTITSHKGFILSDNHQKECIYQFSEEL